MRPIESSGPTGKRTSDGPKPPKWRRTRHRHAISLIEMVTVMWLVSVLLSLSVAYLHSLFSASQAAQQRLRDVSGLQRLTHTFRRDVHRASVAQPALDVKPFARSASADAACRPICRVPGRGAGAQCGTAYGPSGRASRYVRACQRGPRCLWRPHFQEQPPTVRLILHRRAGIKGRGRHARAGHRRRPRQRPSDFVRNDQ